MTRRYGRAPRGERVHDNAPRNYGSHTSVIGAMGLRGLVATLAVEGAVDTLCFDAYLERVLGPASGDVVVLDTWEAPGRPPRRVAPGAALSCSGCRRTHGLSPLESASKIKSYLRGLSPPTTNSIGFVAARTRDSS